MIGILTSISITMVFEYYNYCPINGICQFNCSSNCNGEEGLKECVHCKKMKQCDCSFRIEALSELST